MDKTKRKEYERKYYEKHRIVICEKTIGERCENSINKAYSINEAKIRKMYEIYPYEEYGESCFKRLRMKYELKRNQHKIAMKAAD